MRAGLALLLYLSVLAFAPAVARAQTSVPETTKSDSREFTNNQKNVHFIGHVEMERPETKTSIYAEDVVYTEEGNHAVATGNVLVAQGTNRLAAERAEFNTETGLGTFFNAWGIASVQPPRQPMRSGSIAPPPIAGQDTTVLFFGEKIEKVGPKKYRITNGGFSTCMQPTPRWDLTAGTVVLNIDHYTLLENAVFAVKGVPMFYLPVMYYPTKREGRATGFLLPTYGSSTLRGQSLHDAFFWAINRSQDATIFHDWFSKIGQGVGSEYRYNYGGGSDGGLRAYYLNQHDSTYVQNNGTTTSVPGSKSYELRGGANQILPGNLRARANVNYFSSIQTMQTFNTNVYDATRNQRSYGGNVIGAWPGYTMNTTLDRSEYFYSTTSSNVSGSWPRVSVSRNERPLFGSDLYFTLGTEYVRLVRDRRQTDSTGATIDTDTGLTRLDFFPQVRYPFKKWQWFTVNSTLGWRDTYYTRSLVPPPDNPSAAPSVIAEESLNRRFYTMQAQIVGPVFNRIWDTPNNSYAEKFKHTVEPFVTIQRTSSVDNFSRIVVNDGTDFYVGGTTYQYGINNRFFAKRSLTPGAPAQPREFISVELSQSYYTNQLQSQYDTRYTTGVAGTTGTVSQPSHFSAIALNVRTTPSADVNGSVRLEIDPRYKNLRTVSAQGAYSWLGQLQTTLGWSKGTYRDQFNNVLPADHSVNTATSLRTKDNRFGGVYSFTYDIQRSTLVQQRATGFYNAQCCGVAFEYQTYNFSFPGSILAVPSDHRFFMSFTLAGLGNFSPFNGALGGVPR